MNKAYIASMTNGDNPEMVIPKAAEIEFSDLGYINKGLVVTDSDNKILIPSYTITGENKKCTQKIQKIYEIGDSILYGIYYEVSNDATTSAPPFSPGLIAERAFASFAVVAGAVTGIFRNSIP